MRLLSSEPVAKVAFPQTPEGEAALDSFFLKVARLGGGRLGWVVTARGGRWEVALSPRPADCACAKAPCSRPSGSVALGAKESLCP